MPAFREEANVAETVGDFLNALVKAGIPHAVIVVDDGSDDATSTVIDRLAAIYRDRVIAVHHERNLGYGAAVRTGIDTALRRTGFREILLTDADRQFHADDLIELREFKHRERADAVIGYRRRRADPWRRRLNAKIWTVLCKALLRVPGKDVDCAYKLIDRALLADLQLTGQAAAISPELLCHISTDGSRIVEHPVEHYPREHGEQTGARLSVVIRSLVSLAVVYGHMVRDARRLGWLRRLAAPKDPGAALIALAAAAIAVLAYAYFADQGLLLAYKDANSHLLIARRVVDSPTAGLAQLGGVWLPLPHLLAAPLSAWEALYLNGFAGAAVSMASYVVAVRYLYLHAKTLSGHWAGGLAAAGLFALNPNVLYLQATAMTELLLFACAIAAVHHLHRWCTEERLRDLTLASAAVLAATLTRYEGWILCIVALAVVAYTALRRHRRWSHTEGSVLIFGFIACAGVIGWMAWNLAIFGDPLNWKSGEYADSSLWVAEGEANVGSLGTSAQTYGLAALHNLGIATAVLGLAGLVVYAAQRRLRHQWLTPYALLVFAPFFVFALYRGERPLHVKEVMGALYNVRFGLIMLIPAAIFAGYLVGYLVRRLPQLASGHAAARALPAAALASAAVVGATLAVDGTVTLDEAAEYRASGWETDNAAVAAWLREHHDGGTTLMMSFENESVTFESQVPTGSLVYEGSYLLWEEALDDPRGAGVEWIYMRATPGSEDDVWEALWDSPELEADYELVYDEGDRLVFRAREAEAGR